MYVMRLTKITNHQEELFRNRLSNQLNPNHELFQLFKIILWVCWRRNLRRFSTRSKLFGDQQYQYVQQLDCYYCNICIICLIKMQCGCGYRMLTGNVFAAMIICNGSCLLIHLHSPAGESVLAQKNWKDIKYDCIGSS